MQCNSCKETIDDDSRYCDQCGEQIMVCSVCGRPGKGKCCIVDGKELVPAGGGASTIPAAVSTGAPASTVQPAQPTQPLQPTQAPLSAQIPSPAAQPVQMPQPTQTLPPTQVPSPAAQPVPAPRPIQITQPAPFVQQAPQIPAAGDKVKLVSQKHGIMVEAGDGDIIGRKNGSFAGVFGRFNYVSGTHCKVVKAVAGWHIQDMGSTNGTFYNGSRLAPNALYPVASGTIVTIADIELLLTYDSGESGTTRL